MLLQLEKYRKENLRKLLAFAKENKMKLTLVDADKTKLYLPGEPLDEKELKQMILRSRKSGTLKMEDAHKQIRKKINGN